MKGRHRSRRSRLIRTQRRSTELELDHPAAEPPAVVLAHRENQCGGKRRLTEYQARKARRSLRAKNRELGIDANVAAYECPWCGSWHVGHLGTGPSS